MKAMALSTLLLTTTTFASAAPPTQVSIAAIERTVRLPTKAQAAQSYVRYYASVRAHSAEELPFTTIWDDASLPKSGRVIAAIFVLPPLRTSTELVVEGTPRAVPTERSGLPSIFHGGCRVVNVIIDPVSLTTLNSWCNVDDEPPLR
jgi:hypothetical protein